MDTELLFAQAANSGMEKLAAIATLAESFTPDERLALSAIQQANTMQKQAAGAPAAAGEAVAAAAKSGMLSKLMHTLFGRDTKLIKALYPLRNAKRALVADSKTLGGAVKEFAKAHPYATGAAGLGTLGAGAGAFFGGKAVGDASDDDAGNALATLASNPGAQALLAGLLGAGAGGVASDGDITSAGLTGLGAAGGAYGGNALARALAENMDSDEGKTALNIASPLIGSLLGGAGGYAASKALQ